jgi:putative glutamine amidotransferase
MTLKIGIPAQDHDSKFGVNINYLEFIYGFGRPVIILPETLEDYKEIYKIDALVLPGGSDVDTNRYAKLPTFGTYNPNIYLEHFDRTILPALIGKMPIFGICRGLQTLNVLFGGTLKNLVFHPYSTYDNQEVHSVWDARSEEKPNKNNFYMKVNSFHHQAIGNLAKELNAELVDKYDNVVESISEPKRKIFAVQWHPERLLDNYSIQAFKGILR